LHWTSSPIPDLSANAIAARRLEECPSERAGREEVIPMSNLDGVINVKDAPFNAVGDGSTDDRCAVVDALAVALEQDRPLYFPPGNYRVCLTSADDGAIGIIGLHVKSAATILGLSADVSQLTLERDPCDLAPNATFNGFVISNGVEASFHNLTISSPAPEVWRRYTTEVVDPSDLGKTRLIVESHGFGDDAPVMFTGPTAATPQQWGPETDSDGNPMPAFLKRNGETYFVVNAATDSFQVSDVKGGPPRPLSAPGDTSLAAFVLSQTYAHTAIWKLPGDGDLTLDGVRISGGWRHAVDDGAGNHVTRLTSSDLQGSCVTCAVWGARDGVRYEKAFLARDCDFRPAGEHHVYIHPNVAFDMQDCRHYGASWFSFHNFGTDPLTKDVPPAYARISRAYFESCVVGIRTGGAIDPDGKATTYQIVDSVFRNVGAAVELHNPARIASCTFVDCTSGVGTAGSDRASAVTIDGCTFQTEKKAIETGPAASPTAAWNVAQCTFEKLGQGPLIDHGRQTYPDGPPAEEQPDYPLRFTQCSFIAKDSTAEIGSISKTTTFDGCDFHGSWASGMTVANYKVTTRIALRSCRSLIPKEQATLVSTNGATDLLGFELVGGENEIAGWLAVLPPFHGDLALGRMTGADITSAEKIEVTWSADTYRVNGPATIEYIWVNDHDSTTRAASGVLTLIAQDGWALADTGNISPIHTGARNVGELVRLRRDPFADRWVEIGDDEGLQTVVSVVQSSPLGVSSSSASAA